MGCVVSPGLEGDEAVGLHTAVFDGLIWRVLRGLEYPRLSHHHHGILASMVVMAPVTAITGSRQVLCRKWLKLVQV